MTVRPRAKAPFIFWVSSAGPAGVSTRLKLSVSQLVLTSKTSIIKEDVRFFIIILSGYFSLSFICDIE
jgi:hypothetical protein